MRPGRPLDGFKLIIPDFVRAWLEQRQGISDAHDRHTKDALKLLQKAGHIIGEPLPERGATMRMFKAKGNLHHGVPDLTLIYYIQQDQIIFKLAA